MKVIHQKKKTSKTLSYTLMHPLKGDFVLLTVRFTAPIQEAVFDTIFISKLINKDESSVFKSGSTVPLKFQLKDFKNAFNCFCYYLLW